MDPFSYVANADTQVISDLYDAYIQDPNSVDTTWRDFFKGFDFSQSWKGRPPKIASVPALNQANLLVFSMFRKKCRSLV